MWRSGSGLVLGLHRSGHGRLILEHALSRGVRALDTAYSYHRFGSHRALARVAGDLLGQFSISTKVAFFPGEDRSRHSLDPEELRAAVEHSVRDLGRAPDVVFLHNPERVVYSGDSAAALDQLTAAGVALRDAVAHGLCRSWGWSSWDPRPLRALLDAATLDGLPGPQVVMLRAGLLVPADVLDAGEAIADRLGVAKPDRWGMSPFGGRRNDPLWTTVNPRQFLSPKQQAAPLQAVARAAFALPEVSLLAVGTDNPSHLDELITAMTLELDRATIDRYRALLRHRAATPVES
jgi:pyridoxine 4-dehydrogenase